MFCFCAINNEIEIFAKKHHQEIGRNCTNCPSNHQHRDVNMFCHLVNKNIILFYILFHKVLAISLSNL